MFTAVYLLVVVIVATVGNIVYMLSGDYDTDDFSERTASIIAIMVASGLWPIAIPTILAWATLKIRARYKKYDENHNAQKD